MEPLIVQTGDRFGRWAELTRSHGETLSVGRNYSNDLVIADPYVDPEQIRFSHSSGEWRLEVIQKTNPILVNGQAIGSGGTYIDSGDRITIGRTQFHVLSPHHQVEPTRKMLLFSRFGHGQSLRLFALSMMVFACAVEMIIGYQALSQEVNWKELFSDSLTNGLVILFWASIWALTGRLLRHQPNFTAQLGFTALITTLFSIIWPLGGYAEYTLNSVLLGEITLWLITLVFLVVLFRVNLSLATNLKHYTAIAVVTASTLLLTTYALMELNTGDFDTSPEFSSALKPPFAQLSGTRSLEEYQTEFGALFDEVDTLTRQE
ncbi:MAG: FHA domain-containing protein [Gammaproteobacteria bacterium]|nr:FHA domain-containing protein [Gammaproteobacteria bacterium]